MDRPSSAGRFVRTAPGVRIRLFALAPAVPPTPLERRRALRVWILVATIVVLSLSDLYMTLAHLQSAGMGEANPLARLVMSYNSPILLSAWKCACVALAALILILARFRPSGEIACWLSTVVLTALTVHWISYSSEASKFTTQINSMAQQEPSANWVSMGAP